MSFKLIRTGYYKLFEDNIKKDKSSLRIVCPFIKTRVIKTLLKSNPQNIQIVTRYENIMDFYNGVSDITALKILLESGAQIKGIEDLHSKVYIFGDSSSIITSANLTETAFTSDVRECGALIFDKEKTVEVANYFKELWENSKTREISSDTLISWESKLAEYRSKYPPNKHTKIPKNPSEGDFSFIPPYFIKFAGTSNDRASENDDIKKWMEDTFYHKVCGFPQTPRQIKDGNIVFLSCLCNGPSGKDTKIVGRAIAHAHILGKDIANTKNQEDRPWMKKWRYFQRISNVEVVQGPFKNGISLRELEQECGMDSYFCSQVNGTPPTLVYRRKPSVQLSAHSYKWLNKKLNEVFEKHKKWEASDFRDINPV